MRIEHDFFEKAIHRSQHCQRNWDLTREIPERDLELFATAVTQCPSKQNLAFYRAHFVTNRDIIEKIHAQTDGFVLNYETKESTTNPQTLANLLVVFEPIPLEISGQTANRNVQTDLVYHAHESPEDEAILERDRNMAIGISAGYLNLTASLYGYATGCCACFNADAVAEILSLKNTPALLMGIGFSDPDRGRRVHHDDPDYLFPTKPKNAIEIKVVK